MVIGIDASRAFLRSRTGIEEYAYQVISSLRDPLRDERVVLYVRDGQGPDFDLPELWQVRELRLRCLWTHVRLSIEMLLRRPDVLFIPAHTVPFIHPRKTIVTIHGLEYEFSPESYSFRERLYMRSVIRYSCYAAETIVAVSENTKGDLVRLYGVPKTKIRVVYEGKPERQITGNVEQRQLAADNSRLKTDNAPSTTHDQRLATIQGIADKPYLLFIGRIEERKNVRRIVEAFGILKERHNIAHVLVLAGKPGFGYANVKKTIDASTYCEDIIETGYVSEKKKLSLLSGADMFLFPSLYEGFGLPVVESQAAGVPVVTSSVSSLPEIGRDGALYADPLSAESIAERVWKLLSDVQLRGGIIGKGRANAKRFSWGTCAEEIAELLRK